ncbi:MAG: rod shape-determining protein MreD [Planctomycetes bacterium]|nr:rod shape-determining protein MreD [Planctomycetota bacterium]
MRWSSFAILTASAIVLQTSATPLIQIQSVRPDLMLVLAVHYALWGPWPDAAIAAWIIGLATDLQSNDRIGVHALCFGLAAWGIMRIRQVVFRDHAITQVLITLAFTAAVHALVGLYRLWGTTVSEGGIVWPALMTGVYTAVCAPYLYWLLIRLSRWTGLRPTRGLLASQ